MSTLHRGGFCVLLSIGLTLACSDGPTVPSSGDAVPDAALIESTEYVRVVTRAEPLTKTLSVTRTVGLLGGTISMPEAGLTILVPPGAVTSPTAITVVAPSGDRVGYHFHPSGTRFAVPLVALQDLTGTDAQLLGAPLVAAHFEGDLEPVVEALELLPLDLSRSLGVFDISHFSGYVIGTN